MEEIWKDINGFEGMYQISNLGRVKSIERTVIDKNNNIKYIKEHIMSSSNNGNGYLSVMLYKDNKGVRKLIHRLVAQAFIPNPQNLPEVNHIDENRGNNVVTNLEWIDYLTNRTYGTRLERLSASNTIHAPVVQYDLDFNYIAEYKNAIQAAKALGFDKRGSAIYECANKKANIAYGYIWRYKDDKDIYTIPIPGKFFKNIYQYDATTGDFIKHYYNYKTASNEMNITPVMIRRYMDKPKAIHNFFWCSKLLNEEEIQDMVNDIQNLPVKGVKKDGNKWYSEIKYDKQHFLLGSYYNKIDAIKIRLQKELELYGVYNSPQSYLFNKYLGVMPYETNKGGN